jgi:hypothetical protein
MAALVRSGQIPQSSRARRVGAQPRTGDSAIPKIFDKLWIIITNTKELNEYISQTHTTCK